VVVVKNFDVTGMSCAACRAHVEKSVAGIIAAADRIKENSENAIKELKKMNIRAIMITGDNEATSNAIAARAGISEVIAGVLPSEKEMYVCYLQDSDGVTAEVSLDNGGSAEVPCTESITDEILTKTVEDAGYEVVSIV
jgi:P-type E1-E2 ATPase